MHVSLALARWHLEIEVFDLIILSHDPLPDLGIKIRVTLVLQYYFTGLVLFPVETMKLGLYGTISQGIVLKDTPASIPPCTLR